MFVIQLRQNIKPYKCKHNPIIYLKRKMHRMIDAVTSLYSVTMIRQDKNNNGPQLLRSLLLWHSYVQRSVTRLS